MPEAPLGLIRPILRNASVHRLSRSLSSSTSDNVSSSRYEQLRAQAWEHWEESSGQRELDRLKVAVQSKSSQFDAAVENVQTCRTAVEDAQRSHDDLTKVHAHLVMRREQWDQSDAAAFVDCTAREVRSRTALAQARDALRKAEDDASRQQRDYMDAMRQRYHEEQMWQEKWRMLGTYGTWCLIGLNSVVFLGSQLFHMRRESNRLKSIEVLISENLQQMQQSVSEQAEHAETIASMSRQAPAAKLSNAKEKVEKENESNIPGQAVEKESARRPIDWMRTIKELDYKTIGNYIKDLKTDSTIKASISEVHVPSAAVGAIASTTVLLLVLLTTGKR